MKKALKRIISVMLFSGVVVSLIFARYWDQWSAPSSPQDTDASSTAKTTASTDNTTTTTITDSQTSITIKSTTKEIVNTTKTSTKREPLSGSHRISVPLIAQKPEFPTGCESVSAAMALRYFGETISVTRFINQNLPMSTNFYYKDGLYYGPSPYEFFIGNPTSERSYGCMAPVIEKALVSYFGDNDRILNVTGTGLKELCTTYIDNDLPVLVWVTIAMIETTPGAAWRFSDGTIFEWPNNEHCMVLVGYDEKYYYFNDPYTGTTAKYSHSLSELRYGQLGQQAIVIMQ